jgi:hypothetical protein
MNDQTKKEGPQKEPFLTENTLPRRAVLYLPFQKIPNNIRKLVRIGNRIK